MVSPSKLQFSTTLVISNLRFFRLRGDLQEKPSQLKPASSYEYLYSYVTDEEGNLTSEIFFNHINDNLCKEKKINTLQGFYHPKCPTHHLWESYFLHKNHFRKSVYGIGRGFALAKSALSQRRRPAKLVGARSNRRLVSCFYSVLCVVFPNNVCRLLTRPQAQELLYPWP